MTTKQTEDIELKFLNNYKVLTDKYGNASYNDFGEFVGNAQFGISKELYIKYFKTLPSPVKRLATQFLEPLVNPKLEYPDWRSVDGVTGKWQKQSNSKVGKVFVQSIKKINKQTAVDLDFCKLFPNHWLNHCASYDKENRKNTYPIFAHNKKTGRLEGYIFPVPEYGN